MSIAKLESYGLLQVAGEDARAFLHAQLTNDLENLPPGQARYAGWCSAKGRLLATFLVVPSAAGFLLQLSRDLVPSVVQRLAMFILRSKVKISDASDRWVQYGLWGPAAGGPLCVSQSGASTTVHIEPDRTLVFTPEPSSNHTSPNASFGDWDLAEVRAGRPRIVLATQDQFVPQMVNLELAGGVDFRKGCYPGQEIVARAQYRGTVKRRMVRLRGAALQPGQALYSDDAPGHVSGTVVNAAGDEALAVLPIAVIEAQVPIRAQPQAAALEVLPLPYAQ
ncbi:MAG: folate-binding protein [Betaproteobacteria bacterium]|nr:folate-binding protein [Betaproteobacteria bacterium]MSQ89001.1 folate-binding protein [Betaproteobacteria bacterium]